MGDLRVQWQEEVKVVFYNMWDDYILQRRIEKAEANFYCGIEIRDDLLSAFNVQYNNRAFLEELRRCEEEKYGYDYFVEWLTQLMDDYVRRSFEQKGCPAATFLLQRRFHKTGRTRQTSCPVQDRIFITIKTAAAKTTHTPQFLQLSNILCNPCDG